MIVKQENLICDIIGSEISDIDIVPGTKSIVFKNSTYRHLCVNLYNSQKVFPDVEELIFESNVHIESIPNSMFPNVKKLKKNKTSYFTNVFYSDEDTVINLQGYTHIDVQAFKGCKTKKVVNTEGIEYCDKSAFDDSAFMEAPFIDGMKIAGTILYDIDYGYEEICMPDYITCITDGILQMDKIKKLRVISLNNECFGRKSQIAKEIIIDDSITDNEVPYDIFSDYRSYQWLRECEKLTFPDSITRYKVIDDLVYDSTGTILLTCPCYKKGDVIIPEGVEIINANAFVSCKNIESVTLPESLICFDTSYNKYRYGVFAFCDSLKNVNFNNSLKTITTLDGNALFSGKNKIKELTIPEQVTIIGTRAFCNMTNVERIKFPKNLKVIGDYAFSNIDSLKEVKIPNSVSSIGTEAFLGVRSIISDTFKDNLLNSVIMNNSKFHKIDVLVGNPTVEDCIQKYLVHFQIGEKDFYVPEYIYASTIRRIEKIVTSSEFAEEKLCITWQDNISKEIKDMVNIAYYKIHKSEIVKKEMKRRAKNIAMNLLDSGFEHLFITFLEYDLISATSLQALEKTVSDRNMISLQAYILNKINMTKNKGGSFKL